MAPLLYLSFRKVLVFYLILCFCASSFLLSASADPEDHRLESSRKLFGRRRALLKLEDEDEQQQSKKKSSTTTSLSIKNQTKLIKPTTSFSKKNQTKLIKTTSLSSKNQTKITKPTNSTKSSSTSQLIKKLNTTSSQLKKLSDPIKVGSLKNKTTKPTSTKQTQTLVDKKLTKPKYSQKQPTQKDTPSTTSTAAKSSPKKKQQQPSWVVDEEEEEDLVAGFRDLPTRFQQTLIPDLERISLTSKNYIARANKEMTKGFKPLVGNKYAPTIASFVSFAFILIPLILVSLLFNRIKAYFSLQKILIFIQVYLAIYFSILCLSSLVTGLEPLRFFYATSHSTYVCLMILQTLAYVLYLLLLLMYLVLIFSTECGLASRMLGLAQTFVGFSVGLHYYVAVFHRVVLHQPPKTNWKIHAIYATCFLVICVFATAERRKKAYLEEGGEEGKKN